MQHAFRQAGFLEHARDDETTGHDRAWIGLEHDRIAGRQRRPNRPHRQDEREVERRDDANDAARNAARDADAAGIRRQHQALRLGAHRRGAIETFRHQVDFEAGFGRNAAGLTRDPGDQFLLIVFQHARGLAQDGGALFVRRRRPQPGCAARASAAALRTSAAVALPTLVILAPVAGSTTSSDPPAALRHSVPKTRPRQVSSMRNFPAGAFIAVCLPVLGLCRVLRRRRCSTWRFVIF
jgi:hypothetical protein